jgi:flagellar FliL protein
MLLVPDDAEAMDSPGADPASAEAGKGGAPSARSMQKVELDLDDAPFLAEEEAKPEPVEAQTGGEQAKAETGAVPLWKRKKVVLALAAVLILALAGGGVAFFLMRPKAEVASEAPQPALPALPPAESKPPAPVLVPVKMEPFLVEQTDRSGSVRFLSFRFSVATDNPKLTAEIRGKMLVLRDAVYYYLRNKSFDYLADTRNLETLKFDVVTVMNQYLGEDQLDNLQIEEYLVR